MKKVAAGILFTDGKKILLLKRSADSSEAGTWGIPGGGVKKNESQIQNAIREVKEETGLSSIPGKQVAVHQFQDSSVHFTTFIFKIDKPFTAHMSKEHTSYEWVPLNKLSGKNLHPKFKKNLEQYLGSIRRKVRDFKEWIILTTLLESLRKNP